MDNMDFNEDVICQTSSETSSSESCEETDSTFTSDSPLDFYRDVICQTSSGTNSSESSEENTLMEITNAELDESTLDTEVCNQQNMEISPSLENKEEKVKQGLFAPFSHQPDPEFTRLELERSALNQEAYTKLINDRFKWMKMASAMRREKEQKDNFQRSIQRICSRTEDQSVYWDNGFNGFVKLNYLEINTKENISSKGMLKTVAQDIEYRVQEAFSQMREQKEAEKGITFTQVSQKAQDIEYRVQDALSQTRNEQKEAEKGITFTQVSQKAQDIEYRVQDALSHMRNEQKETEKGITFTQVSQKVGAAKRRKLNLFSDEDEAVGTSFEELLGNI